MAGAGVVAVVLAAGQGRRMRARRNTAFLPLGGRPVLAWSLELFERAAEVERVLLVAASGDEVVRLTHRFHKCAGVVPGGPTRQESEWNGLQAAAALGGATIVLVHDAARPFAAPGLLSSLIAEARQAGGAVPAVPASPRVVATAGGMVSAYPTGLWAAQTPQAFRFDELLAAHRQARVDGFEATDTASIYERAGGTVRIVASTPENLKITTPADLARARAIARRRSA